jgi:excisionase family DNA binding protein
MSAGTKTVSESAAEMLTVDIEEAARRLGLSAMSVRRLVDAGRLKRLKIGRSVRFRPADLQAFVDAEASYKSGDENE